MADGRRPPRARRAAQKEDAAVESLKKTLAVLDKLLESRTFLVGHSVTLADIVMVCNLSSGMKTLFDPAFRAAFPSVCRYYATVANQPQVAKVLGAPVYCDKAPVYARACPARWQLARARACVPAR